MSDDLDYDDYEELLRKPVEIVPGVMLTSLKLPRSLRMEEREKRAIREWNIADLYAQYKGEPAPTKIERIIGIDRGGS